MTKRQTYFIYNLGSDVEKAGEELTKSVEKIKERLESQSCININIDVVNTSIGIGNYVIATIKADYTETIN